MIISQRDINENVNIRQIKRRSLLSILKIGEIVFIGCCHLQTFVGTYKHFIFIGNVRKSLWNSVLGAVP